MRIEIDLPELPRGCSTCEYRALFFPIDPRAYVLIGDLWRKASEWVNSGGSWWIVCFADQVPEAAPQSPEAAP